MSKKKRKLKVGDKVRVIDNSLFSTKIKNGDVGIVTSVTEENNYLMKIKDGIQYFAEDDIGKYVQPLYCENERNEEHEKLENEFSREYLNTESKTYTVIIQSEDGKIIKKIKSDCIIAAVNNVDEDKMTIIQLMKCMPNIGLSALKSLDEIKNKTLKDNPRIGLLYTMDKLGNLFDKDDD